MTHVSITIDFDETDPDDKVKVEVKTNPERIEWVQMTKILGALNLVAEKLPQHNNLN